MCANIPMGHETCHSTRITAGGRGKSILVACLLLGVANSGPSTAHATELGPSQDGQRDKTVDWIAAAYGLSWTNSLAIL